MKKKKKIQVIVIHKVERIRAELSVNVGPERILIKTSNASHFRHRFYINRWDRYEVWNFCGLRETGDATT